jgi:hypothetical protein
MRQRFEYRGTLNSSSWSKAETPGRRRKTAKKILSVNSLKNLGPFNYSEKLSLGHGIVNP